MKINQNLLELSQKYFANQNFSISLLKGDGSDRLIYRVITEENKSIVAVFHNDLKENQDFIYLTAKMEKKGIKVPKILAAHPEKNCYLLEDLGDNNLADQIDQWEEKDTRAEIISAYKKVIDGLLLIQNSNLEQDEMFFSEKLMAGENYLIDIKYFKDNFIKLCKLERYFNSKIESEINQLLISPLTCLKADSFVYRDFQSRNIMWRNNQPCFIDYQSALKGPIYYDLASMLYASRSGLSESERTLLTDYYFKSSKSKLSRNDFEKNLYLFVLFRRLRSLGSYGYLSLVKQKDYFFKSIYPTLEELLLLFSTRKGLENFKYLPKMIGEITADWNEIALNLKS